MSTERYAEEFKIEVVKQITDRGHPTAEMAGRLNGRRVANCCLIQ